jgi:glycosyltransferase involved in cell wall biosynthesis
MLRAEAVTYNRGVVDAPRVAVNASIIGLRTSGLGEHARGLVRALDALHEPLVVHTALPEALAPLRAAVRRAPSALRPDGGLRAHLARMMWTQLALRRRLASDRADVLVNTIPEGPLVSAVPQVTVVHDLIPLDFPDAYPRQQLYFRRLVPAMLRRARMVVAVSEATRRRVLDAYGLPPARVRTILNGFDADRFSADGPALGDGGLPYVLFVGNVLPHKNLPRLVEAVARVTVSMPARLVVAGAGRPRAIAQLRALAERVRATVEIRSTLPPAELPPLLRGARALVLPSLAEGFGLPAVEAMACGTPVIASNVSALPEVVGDAALLVDPLDVAALGDAIARVLSDDRLRKELSARGRERAARFSWSRCGAAMLDVAREVAA